MKWPYLLAAALLLACSAPAEAQYAPGQPLRGSIGPQEEADGSAAAPSPGNRAQSEESAEPDAEPEDGATPTPLGGMGDEPPDVPPTPPLQ